MKGATLNTARRGLAMLVGVGVMISICHYSNGNVVANTVSPSVIENVSVSSQAIFIETGSSITSNTIIGIVDNPKKITVKMKKLKAKKIFLSLDEVRKKINKDMDLSKPSGLPKSEFVTLIQNMDYDYTGVFKRNAAYIWDLAHKYHFNEIFFMGIIANESKWGSSKRAIETNNYTSQSKLDKSLIHYASERECFKQTAENLSKNYLTKGGKYYHGKTLYKVNLEYCEPGVKKEKGKKKVYKYMWADDVYGCMKMIIV